MVAWTFAVRARSRMGYMDYAVVDSVFEMIAPSRQGKAFAALAETSKNENS